MTILKFISEYPDDTSCKLHFKQLREKEGIKCKNCNCTKHYWLKAKWQWQCSSCGFRTTLKSGTMFQDSNLPIRTWYLTMAFMTHSKKGISACEMQRQLNHSRYNTIWTLMHRIRNIMGNRDARYQLKGMIEFDEAYFAKAAPDGIKLKRGKGSQKKQNVAVMAESTFLEEFDTGKKSKQCRYYKMLVLDGHSKENVNKVIEECIHEKSIVFSDKATSYVDIQKYVETHITIKSSKEVTQSSLKWVHIAIANAKRTLLGIYHKIKGKYLQLYLDEFCYKLNRRFFGENLFDRLILASLDNQLVRLR